MSRLLPRGPRETRTRTSWRSGLRPGEGERLLWLRILGISDRGVARLLRLRRA